MLATTLDAGGAGGRFPFAVADRAGADVDDGPIVLFVEDHPTVRFTVTADLHDAGYTVVTAANGEEALGILQSAARIDLLLTDLRLPGTIDGWDIAERARLARPDLPVIYASAYSYVTPRQVPGSVVLDKPYPREALLDALDDLLG